MSNPLDVTTLNATCDPSNDQAGFRPLVGCGKRVSSSPVSGSTVSSSGEPLRFVAKPSVNRPVTTEVCRPAPENQRVDVPANRRRS
jgi:hypothetical protein